MNHVHMNYNDRERERERERERRKLQEIEGKPYCTIMLKNDEESLFT